MALIESLLIIGLIVPGVPIMFALGALAGAGAMDPVLMLIWGWAGAIVGDGISYQLGYHFHQRIRYWWPFKNHPQWLKKGEDFFRSHGDMSIALGRFIGPVRPVIPVVAGMLYMPPKRFYTVNVLSAIPWSPVYLMPGFLAGAAIQANGEVPRVFFILMAVLISCAVIIPALTLWLSSQFRTKHLLAVSIPVSFITLGALITLEYTGTLSEYNMRASAWLADLHMIPYFKESMEWLTWIGSLKFLLIPMTAWIAWSYYQRKTESFITFFVAFAGMELSFWGLKWWINSPRPSLLENIDPFAFPSGHTTQAVFLLLWLSIQVSNGMNYVTRLLIISTAMMMAFLTGLSRLALNVHWLWDVATGFILGLLWLFLTLYASTPKTKNQE
ncbi:MAG: VTT domain-containing protein [Candidatus Endonucleobacter bathymodioli]|uniref:VTT domain-containing protein n=1 Tax=Candidatus Endonucleibacter bathymodioli TaxID=539814 RepID=A0AA90ST92_9GAMM|nr:VTT domain-containing protein [Candidatus Endonucleobacter bathymodioli]